MKKIYQFIVKIPDQVITISAESLEEAVASAQNSLGDKKYRLDLAGMFEAQEFGKLLKLSTVLVESPKIESLEAMAEMLKSSGYDVIKRMGNV